MNHENCRHLLSSLSDYIDGTLDETLCSELERHMNGCDNCRIVIDSLRKTISLYQATSQNTVPPAGVRERLFHRLELDDFLK
jgi:anti-sigma factor RsiW